MSDFNRSTNEQLLERIRSINVNRNGDRRAPHKPLLLLVAIANLLQGKRELSFAEVENLTDNELPRRKQRGINSP